MAEGKVPRTEFVGKLLHAKTTTTTTTKRPKIFFIKPITLRKRPPKDINLKNRNTKSLIGYNGLFDLNSLKVFTKDNVTSLSSWRKIEISNHTQLYPLVTKTSTTKNAGKLLHTKTTNCFCEYWAVFTDFISSNFRFKKS